jgi:addiction module HigA family antidote
VLTLMILVPVRPSRENVISMPSVRRNVCARRSRPASEAAKSLGVTRQQLHNLIAGRSAVTTEMAVRLEKALGSTAETWVQMQMNYDLAQIRRRASSIRVKRIAPRRTGRAA